MCGIESPLAQPGIAKLIGECAFFWRQPGDSDRRPDAMTGRQAAIPVCAESAVNPCLAMIFFARLNPCRRRIFGPLQALSALLYAGRVRKTVSPYSSVAQR
jgi:hypothetical protein